MYNSNTIWWVKALNQNLVFWDIFFSRWLASPHPQRPPSPFQNVISGFKAAPRPDVYKNDAG